MWSSRGKGEMTAEKLLCDDDSDDASPNEPAWKWMRLLRGRERLRKKFNKKEEDVWKHKRNNTNSSSISISAVDAGTTAVRYNFAGIG